jgi:hypothetical protein
MIKIIVQKERNDVLKDMSFAQMENAKLRVIYAKISNVQKINHISALKVYVFMMKNYVIKRMDVLIINLINALMVIVSRIVNYVLQVMNAKTLILDYVLMALV